MDLARLLCALTLVGTAACGSDRDVQTEVGAPVDPLCERVTAFADALENTGIVYDYEPSASPSNLATRSDVVLAGTLTGEFAHREEQPDEPAMSWVGFEVEVVDVAQGSVEVGDRVYVAVPYNPAHRPASDYEASVVAGVDVVVFAQELADPPAELFVGVEGFATACEGEPPIGLVGTSSDWRDATTLAALFESADQPTGRAEVTLWHCGIDTITFEDRVWEVPNGEEPFDGTNAPGSFVGRGTIERVRADELRYVDESGVVLRFVPDDGTEPPCA
jgi:hypothetical protein